MQIERYFQQIRDTIDRCLHVQNVDVDYDRRDKSTGFIRGNITFLDGSILHVREFTSVTADVNRLMYSYQYMDSVKKLIFRYDDADHHRHLNLPTHPHHKHDGSEENIVAAAAPTLAKIWLRLSHSSSCPESRGQACNLRKPIRQPRRHTTFVGQPEVRAG